MSARARHRDVAPTGPAENVIETIAVGLHLRRDVATPSISK
jgi:hypothetical protein